MSTHIELSRFSANGKTFFFNKGHTKTGGDYLAINALWGQGNKERVLVFPAHYLQFVKHATSSIEQLAGVDFAKEDAPAPAHEQCPNCNWHLTDDDYNREHF